MHLPFSWPPNLVNVIFGVNAIASGAICTPMHGDDADQSAGLHLLNRVGEVTDIAQMVYTVAKSNFITGAIIHADGGMPAGYNLN